MTQSSLEYQKIYLPYLILEGQIEIAEISEIGNLQINFLFQLVDLIKTLIGWMAIATVFLARVFFARDYSRVCRI